MEDPLFRENPPRSRDELARELAGRALSDAELIAGGADFDNGTLFVTEEQLARIAVYGRSEPAPENRGWGNGLREAIVTVRDAYLGKKLTSARDKLREAAPAEYLQVIRNYIEATAEDQTKLYDIRHLQLVGSLVAFYESAQQDIAQYTRLHGNFSWQKQWSSTAEDRMQNFAVAGTEKHIENLHIVTGRMANYAEYLGMDAVGLSFAELPDDRRDAIITEAYQQWQELAWLGAEHGVYINASRYGLNRVSALRFRNLDELRTGIASRPDIEASRIINLFLQRPRAFNEVVPQLQVPGTSIRAKGPRLTQREIASRERATRELETPSVPTFSEALEPGEIIQLQSIDQLDDVVFATVARMDSNAARLYGEPTGNVWSYTQPIGKIGARIRPKKFYGQYVNPRMVILPSDDEFIDSYLSAAGNNDEVDRTSFTRLQTIVDMKSSGRGIVGQSLLETVVYTRNIDDQANRKHVVSVRGIASGNKVNEYVQAESSAIGRKLLEYALRNPLQGGLVNPR